MAGVLNRLTNRGYLVRFRFVIVIFLTCFPYANATKIVQLQIEGAIGPATADYIIRNIDKSQHVDLILITLDTPGGLDKSTRDMIQKFLASNVPIITYVSPNGARAASAGTYLLYASTLAAMAPGTHLGAATPVNISAAGFTGTSAANKQTAEEKKMTNDALATIRSLAQLRGRNPEFAEKAILNAATLTSKEALTQKVINTIAVDEHDLLSQINGLVVNQNNQKITINTVNPEIQSIKPDWRTHFLSVITDPTVAYLLLLLGIYGIFFELVNPGYVLPGVVGAISMLIALYALQLLPINYAGFFLIIIGMAFIITELFVPAYGSLGIGGTIAFVLGSIMLIDTENQYYQLPWSIILAMAAVNLFIFIVLLGMVLKVRHQKIKHGVDILIGAKGQTLAEINPTGQAIINGEIWSVHSRHFIAAKKSIKVIGTSGLILEIKEESGSKGG